MISAPVLLVLTSDRHNDRVVRAEIRVTFRQVDLQLNGGHGAITIAGAQLPGLRSALILQFCRAITIHQCDADYVLVPFVARVALNFAVEVNGLCALQVAALDLRQRQPEVHLVQVMRSDCVVLRATILYDCPQAVLVDPFVATVQMLGDVPVFDHLFVSLVLVIFDQIVALDEIGVAGRRREHNLSERHQRRS